MNAEGAGPQVKVPSQPAGAPIARDAESARAQDESFHDYYARLEFVSWTSDPGPTRNLQMLLRCRYHGVHDQAAAAASRAAAAASTGRMIVWVAVAIALLGWLSAMVIAWFRPTFWPVLAATSGATLLVLAIAALVFRVSEGHETRSMIHHAEATRTRRVEAAIRLMMVADAMNDPSGSRSVRELAVKLLDDAVRRESEDGIRSPLEVAGRLLEKGADVVVDSIKPKK